MSEPDRERFEFLVGRLAFDFRSEAETETLHKAIIGAYDTLQAKVREYHEKYVHQDLLFAEQDKVRELERQVADYAEQLETRDAYGQMQAKISDLEAKLRQVEGEREQLGAALRVTVKWMQWWIDQRECDCENGTHSCGLRERINELSQAKRALEGVVEP